MSKLSVGLLRFNLLQKYKQVFAQKDDKVHELNNGEEFFSGMLFSMFMWVIFILLGLFIKR